MPRTLACPACRRDIPDARATQCPSCGSDLPAPGLAKGKKKKKPAASKSLKLPIKWIALGAGALLMVPVLIVGAVVLIFGFGRGGHGGGLGGLSGMTAVVD